MIATMKDYSKDVKKYFHGGTSLIKAYNYLKDLENKQNHNALEDAKMLSEVFMRIKDQEPLAANPFVEQTITSYNFPTGRFFCKSVGKNAKEREFDCIQDAIEWLIETNICKDSRDAVRRDKMAAKIMKAIRKKDRYMNYKWRRIK
jgi:DNA polymerase III epsilon subunit-like protein